MSKSIVVPLTAILTLVGIAFAQTFQAEVTGVVRDSSGAVLAGIPIIAANLANGTTYPGKTDARGAYRLTPLPPGNYKLTCSIAGFKTFEQSPVTLQVNQQLEFDIRLEPGDIKQEITVNATPAPLETATATLGQVVTTESIENLPLNVRDTFALIALTPGVVFGPNFGNAGTSADIGRNFFKSDMNIGGGRSGTQQFLIDGAPDTNGTGQGAINPPVDSVQEFKVMVNSYDAQFGRTSGGTMVMVTKSGANQLHGVLYDYERHSVMDANNFFSNRADLPLTSFQRHQFGANAGGPIRKNKLFFFGDYEGLRQGYPVTSVDTVPTPLQRQGNFSQTYTAAGSLIQIYDPNTLVTLASGTRQRTAFPGNIIPASRLNPVSVASLPYFPLPSRSGVGLNDQNNYTLAADSTTNTDKYDVRTDLNITENTHMFVRVSRQMDDRIVPGNLPLPEGGWRATTDHYTQGVADLTRVGTPNLVIDGQFSATRGLAIQNGLSAGFNLASLGFPAYYVKAAAAQFPTYNIVDTVGTENIAVGNDATVQSQPRNMFVSRGSVSWLRGSHSLKFGGEWWIIDFNEGQWNDPTGLLDFGRSFTQGPNPNQATANGGYGFASFLLGVINGGDIQQAQNISTRALAGAAYIQDDWRVSSRLTLNLGLRYDLMTGNREKYNRIAYFDPTAASPLAGPAGLPNLKGELAWVGQGNSVDQQATDPSNFGPRLGFAYRITNKFVMRGGAGIFYVPRQTQANGDGAVEAFRTTSIVSSLGNDGVTPATYLTNPFPTGILPSLNDRNPLANVGATLTAPFFGFKTGYAQTWSFGLQRELPWGLLVSANYWGNKSVHLVTGPWNVNQLPDQFLSLGSHLNDQVPNPFYGLITTGSLTGATFSRQQSLLPFPQYSGSNGVQEVYISAGNSSYEAFSLSAERRFSSTLTMLVSFTGSKAIDDFGNPLDVYNRQWLRAVSSYDTPRQFLMTWVYHLPVGRGRQLGAHWNRVTNGVLGGWALSGIGRVTRGQPVAIGAPDLNNGTSAKLSNPTIAEWFNTSVFKNAAAFSYGDVGPRLPDVRSDGSKNVDAVLSKSFETTIKDRSIRTEVRAEAFNVFNHPQFGAPNGSVSSQLFGQVTSQTNNPREIQLGAKIRW